MKPNGYGILSERMTTRLNELYNSARIFYHHWLFPIKYSPIPYESLTLEEELHKQIGLAIKRQFYANKHFLYCTREQRPVDQNLGIISVLVNAQWHDLEVANDFAEQFAKNLHKMEIGELADLSLEIIGTCEVDPTHPYFNTFEFMRIKTFNAHTFKPLDGDSFGI